MPFEQYKVQVKYLPRSNAPKKVHLFWHAKSESLSRHRLLQSTQKKPQLETRKAPATIQRFSFLCARRPIKETSINKRQKAMRRTSQCKETSNLAGRAKPLCQIIFRVETLGLYWLSKSEPVLGEDKEDRAEMSRSSKTIQWARKLQYGRS